MPKFFRHKVAGYYLYFTAMCVVEAFHAHASDRAMTEGGSAKFFIRCDGTSIVQKRGMLNDREINIIQHFIADNYIDMYKLWEDKGGKEFYRG